jgi:hypothetical protein
VLLWFLLAFLSEGYGISRALLSENSFRKVVGLVTIVLFGIAYLSMELWYYYGRDEASTDYIYDSIPGIIVLLVQIVYAIWCGYNLLKTYSKEDKTIKRNFYIGINIYSWLIRLHATLL